MPNGLPIAAMPDDLVRAIQSFERLDAYHIHPDRVGEMLPKGLSEAARRQLLDTDRLRDRLDQIATNTRIFAPVEWDNFRQPIACLAILDPLDLERAANLVGAVLEGRSCRRMIFKAERAKLDTLLPDGGFSFVLTHLDLAATDKSGGIADDVDSLCRRIEDLGRRALTVYVDQLPPALAGRLESKLPADMELGGKKIRKPKDALEPSVVIAIMTRIVQDVYHYGPY